MAEWGGSRRGYEAGPEGLEFIVIGAPSLGEARREYVEGQRDGPGYPEVDRRLRLLNAVDRIQL